MELSVHWNYVSGYGMIRKIVASSTFVIVVRCCHNRKRFMTLQPRKRSTQSDLISNYRLILLNTNQPPDRVYVCVFIVGPGVDRYFSLIGAVLPHRFLN